MSPTAYTRLKDDTTVSYRFTKDAKASTQIIVFDYQNKPVKDAYEY